LKTDNYIDEIFLFFQEKDSSLNIQPDDNIIKTSIIDSFGLIELIAYFENKYNLQFAADDLTEEHFESIRSIAQLLSGKMNSQ